jgi:signal transduction histidine kinase
VPFSLTSLKELRLAHNENFFSVEFAALDFTAPEKNQYAYKLEGLDLDWVKAGKRRFAGYTNKGSNNDGIWNNDGVSLHMIITPPYWATWWFRAAIIIFMLALLTGGYQYRVARLLEMERMRVRIASDLHDDIGSSLSGIALITDMVRNQLPPEQQQRQQLFEASRAARHTADALKDIVWILNPENEKLEDIILRMKDSAAKLLLGTEYSFHCTNNDLSNVLDMEFRRNILLIYKECLNNIAKYAHATKVDISIGNRENMFYLTIIDNGVGFDRASIVRGNGLNNMHKRAAKIRGTIDIDSCPGKGTTVHLTAKIP